MKNSTIGYGKQAPSSKKERSYASPVFATAGLLKAFALGFFSWMVFTGLTGCPQDDGKSQKVVITGADNNKTFTVKAGETIITNLSECSGCNPAQFHWNVGGYDQSILKYKGESYANTPP